jgi:hypothetical protein
MPNPGKGQFVRCSRERSDEVGFHGRSHRAPSRDLQVFDLDGRIGRERQAGHRSILVAVLVICKAAPR